MAEDKSNYTKLQRMIGDAIDYPPGHPKVDATIEAVAEWFELLIGSQKLLKKWRMTMTDLTWVQKAGRDQIKKKAQDIYNAFDEATDQFDIKDGEVLRLVLMEVINQLQESPGVIQAPTLYLVAQCIAELEGGNE